MDTSITSGTNSTIGLTAPQSVAELAPQEREKVQAIRDAIDLTKTNAIIEFGAPAQQTIADFSDDALKTVRTKDMGEVGGALTKLVGELKGLDIDDAQKPSLFRSAKTRVEGLKTRYTKVESNVNAIVEQLEAHKRTLDKDCHTLDIMYEKNLEHFREVTLYILAGKERLTAAQQTELPALQGKARQSGLPEDAQAAKDFADQLNRFEKKLYDLELTRTMALQMAPQIRMTQNNDTALIEKIQTSLVHTIPAWKSQMVLALNLADAERGLKAQQAVSDYTNALLRKNAEMLRTTTTGIARESERGIVDIETLKHTNEQLIATLDEVRQIQEDGRKFRREAEVELRRIENELKQKLLEIHN